MVSDLALIGLLPPVSRPVGDEPHLTAALEAPSISPSPDMS
jgi:hypothetical protein